MTDLCHCGHFVEVHQYADEDDEIRLGSCGKLLCDCRSFRPLRPLTLADPRLLAIADAVESRIADRCPGLPLYEPHGLLFLPVVSPVEMATTSARESDEPTLTLDEIRETVAKLGPAPTLPDGWALASWTEPFTVPASALDEPLPDLLGEAMRRLWEMRR